MHKDELSDLIATDDVLKLMLVMEKEDFSSDDLHTILDIATLKGKTDVVRILKSKGADLQDKQEVLIHNAVTSQNTQLIEFLLDQGCHIDSVDHNCWTPLHSACFWGYEQVVRLLVARGAEKTARDDNGVMPFMIAKTEVIRSLAHP